MMMTFNCSFRNKNDFLLHNHIINEHRVLSLARSRNLHCWFDGGGCVVVITIRKHCVRSLARSRNLHFWLLARSALLVVETPTLSAAALDRSRKTHTAQRGRLQSCQPSPPLDTLPLILGRTLLLNGRRFGVRSSHLVHHELVDRNTLACRPAWHLCNGKSFAIPCPFIEGKPKIGVGGDVETAETAETAETVVTFV